MEHPAFAEAGTHAGMEIWRIENFEPAPLATKDYGKFYSGDSYIILKTIADRKGKLSWDVHFWLGSKTSQDESGAAAILTVGLDDKLNGAAVQHREVQGHESTQFLGYFKPGIRYLEGGHASGFNQVTTNAGAEKRLFQIKGKKNIRVRQVEPALASMNKGDCFVLDIDHDIYVYVGEKAKRVEKIKAISVANQIRDQDHNGRATIDIIDEFSSPSDTNKFFEALGSGSRDEVPEESAGGDDQAFERNEEQSVTMYLVTDASGSLAVTPVSKPFKQENLNTNDCYILDTKSGGIYVWVGKGCDAQERQHAMKKAQEYLTSKNYPDWVHVTRVPEGTETAAFKQYFFTWRDKGMSHSRLIRSPSDEDFYASDTEISDQRAKKIGKTGTARGFMPDDGSGEVTVYRIEDFNLNELYSSEDPDADAGHRFGEFYQGDSYVIKYSTVDSSLVVIYFWLGRESTLDEQASAAIFARNMDDELGGSAVQVRVPQGEEPKHFLRIFKGHLVTLMGGKASGFKNSNQKDSYDDDGVRLFKVQGNDVGVDMRAEQVPETEDSLEDDDVFLLETPDHVFVWKGKESTEEEQQEAEEFGRIIFRGQDKEFVQVDQGEEPEEFWNSLGSSADAEHATGAVGWRKRLAKRVGLEPHLLEVTVSFDNQVRFEEVPNYTEEDLNEDNVYLLDTAEEIYIWLGKYASEHEKKSVSTIIETYLHDDPIDRTLKTAVFVVVKEGKEPDLFKRLFDDWDDDMWNNQKSYDDHKADAISKNHVE